MQNGPARQINQIGQVFHLFVQIVLRPGSFIFDHVRSMPKSQRFHFDPVDGEVRSALWGYNNLATNRRKIFARVL